MRIGSRDFETKGHTYIMGILNITPDSFSDGGSHLTIDDTLRHAEQMIREGADILDVGGESTRPGYTKISDDEEIQRVAPVIEALLQHFDVPISVDTYKSKVAEAALIAGAHLVNDIWGLKYDAHMAQVIKDYDAACCLMHNKAAAAYEDFIEDSLRELHECLALAKAAGIPDDKIMLDPGVGFGKTYEHNLSVLKHLDAYHRLGYPVLLGTSRKSVIGLTLDTPVNDRVIGTCVTTVQAVMKGIAFVRVHDVKANKQAILMTEAMLH